MKKNLFPFVLIGISAILIYGGALDIFFYYDDFEWLDKVRNLGQKPLSIFVPVVHPPTSYLTPVTYIVFWLNFKLFGLNPFGYHLFNLILHIINSYLVVYLIFLLRGNLSLAALAGLFFAINFAITDAVIWPSAYVDTVMFFFYMLSLVTFVHFLAKKKNHYYPLSVFFFLLSLSVKGTALTLPIALFIVEKYCAYSKTGTKRLLKYIPFLLIALSYLFLLQYKSISGDVILSHVNIERVFLNILKVPLTLFLPEGLLPSNFWWILLYMFFFLIFALVEIKKDTSGMVRLGGLLALTGILPLFPIEWKFLANPDPLTESIRHRLYLGNFGTAIFLGGIVYSHYNAASKFRHKVLLSLLFLSFIGLNVYWNKTVQAKWEMVTKDTRNALSEFKKIAAKYPPGSAVYFINFPPNQGFGISFFKLYFGHC